MATANYQFHAAITKDGQVVAQYTRKSNGFDNGVLYLANNTEVEAARFDHALLLASVTISEGPGPKLVDQPHKTGFVILPLDSSHRHLVAPAGPDYNDIETLIEIEEELL